MSEITLSLGKLLVERFRISTGFHPGQQEIIERLIQGKRILAIQRTGWGKSLCYQVASLYYPHLTVVFSPLKALMRDQCQRCNTLYSIPAAIISSDFSEANNQVTLEQACAGELKLLYIAPERLSNAIWQHYAPHMPISMIVIDEAHCISTWGHDFRPHYRRIVRLLDAIPQTTPVLGLTATANQRVEEDILQQMGMGVQVIRGTMLRPNLNLHVVQVHGMQEKLSYLGEVLPKSIGVGIIYTATQRDAEVIATFLQSQDINAEYYHSGRDNNIRQEIEQKLMTNHYKVICSTNALGMGIDKQDVRFIIHYHIPASPIHYYQEMGRAGRDGQTAFCILLYDPADLEIQKHFINSAKPESTQYACVLSMLKANSPGLGERNLMLRTGFSRTTLRNILANLEDQDFVERDTRSKIYKATTHPGQINLSDYDAIRQQKLLELSDIQGYAQHTGCSMAYLTNYLGDPIDQPCRVCRHCQPDNFPTVLPSEHIQEVTLQFLEQNALPKIERYSTAKTTIHEAGWALSLHGTTRFGTLVRASKYEGAGPFALSIIQRAVEVIHTHYPIAIIDGVVSVPPTCSGTLVEDFARQVATLLKLEYLPVLLKIRKTQEQKYLKNRPQKEDNSKGAFKVQPTESVRGRTLLLIDDIYDSGHMLRAVAHTLIQAGTQSIYPLTITRTLHSDDQ